MKISNENVLKERKLLLLHYINQTSSQLYLCEVYTVHSTSSCKVIFCFICLGQDKSWDLPTLARREGETMRQTAERALSTLCGDALPFQVLGNAPLSYYKFKYPKGYQSKVDRVGAKVFIYKAYVTAGFLDSVEVIPGDSVLDHQWVTIEEMQKVLDKMTLRAINNMLDAED